MKIEIPAYVQAVLTRLEGHGFEAYAVGGCVRDSMMGKTPHDWDVTTSALPHQTMTALQGFHLIETGLKHGTVTAVVEHQPVEITTFRVDGEYSDNRHPDEVHFTRSLQEDLSRRDFTVNALAYSPKTGLVDYFGGCSDIENKVIRCVGEPGRRFGEDALRILRGLRFASVLSFTIESATAQSLLQNRSLLQYIAAERISSELCRLLCGEQVFPILMDFFPVITEIIPELAPAVSFDQRNPYHTYTVYEHIAHSVAAAPSTIPLRLTMLLHDIAKPACCTEDETGRRHFHGHEDVGTEMAGTILRRLKLDNQTVSRVCTLIKYHDIDLEPTEKCVLSQLNLLGEEVFRELLLVKRADNTAQSEYAQNHTVKLLNELELVLERVLAQGRCFSLRGLAVNGSDLIAAGVPKGVELGKTLQYLLALVIDGECDNKKEKLLAKIPNLPRSANSP
ncbi:HD domain-containing protein [Hydrogenoanaerobacterium sp.]|uniref:CCA tRNA nucleotidyltransferase n=1 Tax=Hydrogenoanaerobacterium sp. TaxID=2953763 RepID=UPI00289A1F12|nr:HD domain-containing protein [Hydrogenoanaerobacterium sp.]